MPIRNPFAKKPGGSNLETAENVQPTTPSSGNFEKVDTVGSKASSMSIRSRESQDTDYKLSVINDSGVYLPPSPPEKKSFWPRRAQPSTGSSNNNSLSEIEPFSISRESFDSYRRSFDISARSPVIPSDVTGRQSLDSARIPRLPRSAMNERRFERQPPTAEEGFEDVGLNEEKPNQPKKKGFFSKFGDTSDARPASPTGSRFHIGGRKRGQSGVGEELGSLPVIGRKRGQSGAGDSDLGNVASANKTTTEVIQVKD